MADNPALEKAIAGHRSVIPVYIWAPEEESPWQPGSASRWWLHQSLKQLQASLIERGSNLILRRGPTGDTLLTLARQTGAETVYWNRRYEPAVIARDRSVAEQVRKTEILAESCRGNLLFEPGTILNTSGKPFQVFSAFWRACLAATGPAKPTLAPARIPGPQSWPASLALADFELEPEVDWTRGMREMWQPGELGAVKQIDSFLDNAIAAYATERDRPDHSGTSRLSPHLHFGEASVRQVWHLAHSGERVNDDAAAAYLRQIGWREFSHHLMFHFPHTPQDPLHQEFRFFPWRFDADAFRAWTRGQTGYPLVDAGMRQLWHTGWMHNRVRMLVASFLVKHLMISWEEGARWFWDTLVDADLANNTMGWQWTSGCGADAAPYFRVFNPIVQGEKFDPEGAYVRRWIPELSKLSKLWIHKPWKAPAAVLSDAKVQFGRDYPWPIVDHGVARARALAALTSMMAR